MTQTLSHPVSAPGALLSALGIPTTGRMVDLSLAFDNDHVLWPGHGPFAHYVWTTHAQGSRFLGGAAAPSPVGMLSDRVEMPLHAGTHIDALNHFSVNGELHGGHRVSDVEVQNGTNVLGVETAPVFLCEGVLLDLVALEGRPLESGEVVSVDSLRRALARQGVAELPRGGVVLLNTGWLDRHYESSRRTYFTTEPGLDLGAAKMLADAGVVGVGADTSAVEAVPHDESSPYPVHLELIVRRGVYIIENVVTDELAAAEAYRFLFVATPLKIRGASGSPIRALAIS